MGNIYIGVNNIARKVKNLYIGVNNVSRKVSKGYVGVSNKAKLFYESGVDPTKSSFTEEEVNALAAYGKINQVAIGSTFTLANSYDTSRSEHTYIVIGKDHKDLNVTNYGSNASAATGTVDVWATGAIASMKFKSTSPYAQWNNSDIRSWLNNSSSGFYGGFNSTTKVHLKRMTSEYYWTTETGTNKTMFAKGNNNTTDYAKLLSTAEFNLSSYDTWYYMHRREGNGYEYFPSVAYNTASSKRYASTTGTADAVYQWTRSLYCNSDISGYSVWRVGSNGSITDFQGGNYYNVGVVPCFRLGA